MKNIKQKFIRFINTLIVVAIGCLILASNFQLKSLLFFVLIPALLITQFISQKEYLPFYRALVRSFKIMKKNLSQVLSLLLLTSVLGILLFSVMDTSILWLYIEFVGWNFSVEQTMFDQLMFGSLIFIAIFILCLVLTLYIFCFSLLYFNLIEIQEAPWLHQAIEKIGLHQSIRGMEKEG